MCGIKAMLYIDKCHNYDLNQGVINMSTVIEFYVFFLLSNRINHAKSLITRFSLRRDRCLHSTVLIDNLGNAKVTKQFFFSFLLLSSCGFVIEKLSSILLPQFSIYFCELSCAKIIAFSCRTTESTMQRINLTDSSQRPDVFIAQQSSCYAS